MPPNPQAKVRSPASSLSPDACGYPRQKKKAKHTKGKLKIIKAEKLIKDARLRTILRFKVVCDRSPIMPSTVASFLSKSKEYTE